MRTVVVAVGVLLALNAAPSWAAVVDIADRMQLSRVISVDVGVVATRGTPGCRVDPKALQTEVELILRRSGILVVEPPYGSLYDIMLSLDLSDEERAAAQLALPHWFRVSIVAVGNRHVCALAHTSQLLRQEMAGIGTAPMPGYVVPFSTGLGTVIGSPDYVSEAVEREVRGIATSLANEILKARQ